MANTMYAYNIKYRHQTFTQQGISRYVRGDIGGNVCTEAKGTIVRRPQPVLTFFEVYSMSKE